MSEAVESRVAALEGWRGDHTREHGAVWKRLDELAEKATQSEVRQATTETKLAIYTSLGVGVGSILGSVIGALLVHLFTRGTP